MKHFVAIVLVSLAACLKAQFSHLNGSLYLLHEGSMNQQGSIGKIDFPSGTYTHLDSIPAYGNDLKIVGNQLFTVAGNAEVRIYQLQPFQLQKTIIVPARRLQVYNNKLYITCYSDPYFKIYDLAADSFIFNSSIQDVRATAEDIWIENNKAYILVNDYGADSLLVIYDLTNNTKIKTLTTTQNPNYFLKIDNSLYFNCLDYVNGLTVQKLDLSADSIVHTRFFQNIISYGGFTAEDTNKILFNNNSLFPSVLSRWTTSTNNVDTTAFNLETYGLYYHIPNNTLFFSQTDYFSSGKIGIHYNGQTALINTFISPRILLWQDSLTTAIDNAKPLYCTVFPNPFFDKISIQASEPIQSLELTDITGRILITLNTLNSTFEHQLITTDLPSGIYFLKVVTKSQVFSQKIIKP